MNTTNKKHKKGEMLIETIISIAVFAIVMLAVSTMIIVSVNLLKSSTTQYEETEMACANVENMRNIGSASIGDEIFYSFDATADGKNFTNEKLGVYKDSPIVIFKPSY